MLRFREVVVPTGEEFMDAIVASALVFTSRHFDQFADELKLEGTPRVVAKSTVQALAMVEGTHVLDSPSAQDYLARKASTQS